MAKNLKRELASRALPRRPAVPVVLEIPWQPPFDAYQKIHGPNSFLLESVSGPPRIGRYSILGCEPRAAFRGKNRSGQLTRDGRTTDIFGDPLSVLRALIEENAVMSSARFAGGAVGYLSYDAGRFFEKLPDIADDDLALPDAIFFLVDTFAVFDHERQAANVVSLPDGRDGTRGGMRAGQRAAELAARLGGPAPATGSHGAPARRQLAEPDFSSNFTKAQFESIVRAAKEYIFAGDIYQVNLSQRLATPLSAPPLEIYRRLRQINPSPFAGFFDFGDWQLIGCSPERLIKLENGLVETRPIAGTVKRGASATEDRRLIEGLTVDTKERAEHIMLVDLERNDIGRVCDYGTVRADELMVTESYSHVTHIVSNVVGRLQPGRDQFDLLRACFPGGTITGCPKIRAMEIIEELEPVKRGPYTGSMGYFGYNGNLDMNIIIRTLIVRDGRAYVQAGAGIVADSQPEREYYETLYKAEALVKAVRQAETRQCRSLI